MKNAAATLPESGDRRATRIVVNWVGSVQARASSTSCSGQPAAIAMGPVGCPGVTAPLCLLFLPLLIAGDPSNTITFHLPMMALVPICYHESVASPRPSSNTGLERTEQVALSHRPPFLAQPFQRQFTRWTTRHCTAPTLTSGTLLVAIGVLGFVVEVGELLSFSHNSDGAQLLPPALAYPSSVSREHGCRAPTVCVGAAPKSIPIRADPLPPDPRKADFSRHLKIRENNKQFPQHWRQGPGSRVQPLASGDSPPRSVG